jgi:hypothetical protein
MLIFVDKNLQKTVFLHVPKCSGEYFRKEIVKNFEIINEEKIKVFHETHFKDLKLNAFSAFERVVKMIDTEYSISKYGPDEHKMFSTYVLYKNVVNFLNPSEYKFIAFVRNPYQRYISIYFHYNNQDVYTIEQLKTKSIQECIAETREKFNTFMRNNYKLIDTEPHQDILMFDRQYKFLVDENGNLPSNMVVHKLEDSLPEMFSSFNNFNIKNYNLDDYYDVDTKELVYQTYIKDFELFGYDK